MERAAPTGFGAASPAEATGSSEGGSPSLPLIVGFCGAAVGAIGFGAGFGASSYRRSVAFKELMEKFPEPPTAEAERLARSGATSALLRGTALAGLMGLGAIAVAKANGIHSANDLADEIRKVLPTKERLEVRVIHAATPIHATPHDPSSARLSAELDGASARAAAAYDHRACAGPSRQVGRVVQGVVARPLRERAS
jgi:hypothetical protein